jgi:hypothetical protein
MAIFDAAYAEARGLEGTNRNPIPLPPRRIWSGSVIKLGDVVRRKGLLAIARPAHPLFRCRSKTTHGTFYMYYSRGSLALEYSTDKPANSVYSVRNTAQTS